MLNEMKKNINGMIFSEYRKIPQNLPYSGFKIPVTFFDSNQKKKIQKGRDSLRPEGNTLKIDFFWDSKSFTLSPLTFLIVIRLFSKPD